MTKRRRSRPKPVESPGEEPGDEAPEEEESAESTEHCDNCGLIVPAAEMEEHEAAHPHPEPRDED